MICPFRVDIKFYYEEIKDAKDGEPKFRDKAQKQVYPICAGAECPFYEFDEIWKLERCKRISTLIGENDE